MTKKADGPKATEDLLAVSEKTDRVERHWIGGKKQDLLVYRIPISELYFNIENGRYADKMIRLKLEHQGQAIDPRREEWKKRIELMLAGEHKDTHKDRSAFEKLKSDLDGREQLRPGVVLADGGVIDGNRRLAALRRLGQESKNTQKFKFFDGVILPANTGPEDRWRIEAGVQLGVNERWDYSPINELLKVRAGLELYQELIDKGAYSAPDTPARLVAKAIYGKGEAEIQEMADRLRLIDEYLEFLERPGQYDLIGAVSERFLEARAVITAAENQQRAPEVIGKLKAILFYQIHHEQMDNWELRIVRFALGADPKKKGPKRAPNDKALRAFMDDFPDAAEIQRALTAGAALPATPTPPPLGAKKPAAAPKGAKSPSDVPKPPVDRAKVEASTARFLRTMETAGQEKSMRKISEAARADVSALEAGLSDKKRRDELAPEDRIAVSEGVEAMLESLQNCRSMLRKK